MQLLHHDPDIAFLPSEEHLFQRLGTDSFPLFHSLVFDAFPILVLHVLRTVREGGGPFKSKYHPIPIPASGTPIPCINTFAQATLKALSP